MPIQQAFGSPGGKSVLAPRIVKMIPKHHTYVEVFAGGAAVFFEKEPSPREILNDRDPEIAAAYRFLKSMSVAQYKKLQAKDWTKGPVKFSMLKKSSPRNPLDRFYRFFYLVRSSFIHARQNFSSPGHGKKIDIDHLPECRKRLTGVTVLSKNGVDIVKQFDGKATFFYLDPPYPGRAFTGPGGGFTMDDLNKLIEALKKVKGKFLVSLGIEHQRLLPKSWKVKKVKVKRQIVSPKNSKTIPHGYEIIAGNYSF